MEDTLVFEIKSSFGVFQKPESTTGGLFTYRAPPKTAIQGMMGSMIGLSFDETREIFDGIHIGIQPLKNPETVPTTYNCHYGKDEKILTNIREETLVNPEYRIFVDFSNGPFEECMNNMKLDAEDKITSFSELYSWVIENDISYYNVYMGKNNFPLSIETSSIDFQEIEETKIEGKQKCSSLIPQDICHRFEVDEKERESDEIWMPEPQKIEIISDLPVSQRKDRRHTERKNFIMKPIGKNMEFRLFIYIDPDADLDDYKFGMTDDEGLIVLF